jgi:serine/threonine protein kinase
MNILSGHLLKELLYESHQTLIYRGIRLLDGLPVIIKTLNQLHPSPERRARFEQEYRLLQRLELDAIATAYSLEREQGQLAIIMEDFGGASLNTLDIAGRLPLDDWLRLAIHITQRLGQLHARQVMHKDINPSNIVWNRETNQLKLIDLGIATELSRELAESRNPDRLEGTLAYISPEQTGCMNRSIDYRTDFYSLGATFYELLTGRLPFSADDASHLVHAHIARQPEPAHQLRPEVPATVSAILDKLLSKTAEERYQSASGLVADSRACLQTLDQHGRIPVFGLATRISRRVCRFRKSCTGAAGRLPCCSMHSEE